MANCTACGAYVSEGNSYCPQCGAQMPEKSNAYQAQQNTSGTYRQPASQGGYVSPQPAYAYNVQGAKPDSVMGTGAFLGSIILMSIPLIGFVLQIVWACGATSNLNRRNMARAYLILTLIGVVCSLFLYFAFSQFIIPLIQENLQLYGNNFYGVWEYIE